MMNIYIKKLLIGTLFFLLIPIFISSSVFATTFDLIAPSGELVRGQDVVFTINIDTEGKSLSSTSIGMTYETGNLEYVSTSAGDTFTTVSSNVQGEGTLIITGTSASPFSGAGTFANVTFKLIATQSGSSQLCTLFIPGTPTTAPTSPPEAPTSPPDDITIDDTQPITDLPESGEAGPMTRGVILASVFLVLATGGYFIFKKI